VIRGIAAAARETAVAQAAQAVLEEGGSAVDAVIAGWFAAAGAAPGVLFAPLVLLVAGAGAGARAFDGRAVQPGQGAPRPRGFVREDEIPAGARVAVPRSLAAIALAHGQRGRVRLGALARAGQTIAEGLGAKRRAAVLRTVGEVAALSLRGRDVSRAFLAAGGVVAGGIVTEQDLEAPQPAEADAVVTRLAGDASAITVPWAPPPERARGGDAIVAVDGRGVVAALGFCGPRDHEAISLPDLECTVAGDAVPVRRGVTRVAPGTVLPASAAIAVISMSAPPAASRSGPTSSRSCRVHPRSTRASPCCAGASARRSSWRPCATRVTRARSS
jgi:gamma-glutamyltranspeptidase/glutathione hydrolase